MEVSTDGRRNYFIKYKNYGMTTHLVYSMGRENVEIYMVVYTFISLFMTLNYFRSFEQK